MKNHVYTYNGTMYHQRKGGPIGLDLTGVLAQIFMVWWDRRLRSRLSAMGLNVHMCKRYVDDINIILGVNNTEGSVTNEREDGMAYDARVMDIVKSEVDNIQQSIRVDVDYPSKHEDNKIPILDLKVWVEMREETSFVLHEFYSKETILLLRYTPSICTTIARQTLCSYAAGPQGSTQLQYAIALGTDSEPCQLYGCPHAIFRIPKAFKV